MYLKAIRRKPLLFSTFPTVHFIDPAAMPRQAFTRNDTSRELSSRELSQDIGTRRRCSLKPSVIPRTRNN